MTATSQKARTLNTLLAQMADMERGKRIRELRKTQRLTQPAVAAAVHVTLRAYQEWEAGGGIRPEHVKLLAKVLKTEPDFIWDGPKAATPDPFEHTGPRDLPLERILERLRAVEQNQEEILALGETVRELLLLLVPDEKTQAAEALAEIERAAREIARAKHVADAPASTKPRSGPTR